MGGGGGGGGVETLYELRPYKEILLSDKQSILQRNIITGEKEVIISEKKQVAEKLNNFFIEAVESMRHILAH